MSTAVATSGAEALVRTLAASVPGGTVLYVGANDRATLVAALAGADITTRVLALCEHTASAAQIQDGVLDDLRLSVHVQELASFLTDIAAHRFGIIVIGPDAAPQVQNLGNLLQPGGLMLALASVSMPNAAPDLEICRLQGDGLSWLATKRARSQPKRRAGRGRPNSA